MLLSDHAGKAERKVGQCLLKGICVLHSELHTESEGSTCVKSLKEALPYCHTLPVNV